MQRQFVPFQVVEQVPPNRVILPWILYVNINGIYLSYMRCNEEIKAKGKKFCVRAFGDMTTHLPQE